jgi:hypothetical protein
MLVAAHGVEDDARHADLPDDESAMMVDSDSTAAIIPRSAIEGTSALVLELADRHG